MPSYIGMVENQEKCLGNERNVLLKLYYKFRFVCEYIKKNGNLLTYLTELRVGAVDSDRLMLTWLVVQARIGGLAIPLLLVVEL